MTKIASRAVVSLLAAAALVACGEKGAAPDPAPSSFLLAQDLEGAVPVLEARGAEAGTEVTVVGRVRRVADGVFTLVDDEAVAYCGRDDADACRTPWDYCCERQDEVAAATLVVLARDAEGGDLRQEEIGLRPLDLVAVRGLLAHDEDGAVTLEARDGWYRRERPEVPDYVRFP